MEILATYSIYYIVPIIALGLTYFLKPTLKQGVGLLLLGTALQLVISYITTQQISWSIIILAAAGLLLTVILLGFLGNKISQSNYSAILLTLGLYPWEINTGNSIIFLALTVIGITINSQINSKKAFKKLGVSRAPVKYIEKYYGKETLENYKTEASIFFSPAITIAMIISIPTLLLFLR